MNDNIINNAMIIYRLSTGLQVFCETTNDKKLNREMKSTKFRIMFIIYDQKRISPSYICDKLNLIKSNVALTCKQLVKEGYINSCHDEKDKRIIYYYPTPIGENYIEKLLFLFDNYLNICIKEKNLKNVISKLNEIYNLIQNKEDQNAKII